MTTFAIRIRPSVQAELDAAAAAELQGHFHTAFLHLERAHILGQPVTVEHVRVHWHMLRFALRHRRTAAALGQAWRVLAASVFTGAGLVPEGNTGGSDVNGFRRMPVPHDLQPVIAAARAGQPARSAATVLAKVSAAAAFAVIAASAALGLAGCSTAPKDLDVSLEKPSAAGLYRIALVPPDPAPAINQIHGWKVRLATRDGIPVQGATFAVDGGMPQHGHGLPTQPRVTRELADGSYQLDGMKFSMGGWWEVKLRISGSQGADTVTFNTVVGRAPVRQ